MADDNGDTTGQLPESSFGTGALIGTVVGVAVVFIVLVICFGLCRWRFVAWRHRRFDRAGQVHDELKLAEPTQERPSIPAVSTSLSPYEYRPLPSDRHIRLLTLAPGGQSDPVTCSLTEVDLEDSSQRFEAVSYRWGGDVHTVVCEGRRLPVTQNLYYLLARLRREGEPRFLWADALCINQGDTREKSVQVPLMSQIYTRCDECLCWLGWHGEDVILAFELISILHAATERKKALSGNLFYELLQSVGLLGRRVVTTRGQWEALRQLLQNAWFGRIWTVQEAVLPLKLTFLHGQFELAGEQFWAGLEFTADADMPFFIRKPEDSWAITSLTAQMRATLHGSEGSHDQDILDLLRNVRTRDGFDPRDKVMGVAGIIGEEEFRGIELDYLQTAAVVYQRTASYILKTCHKPLRLLYAAGPSLGTTDPRDAVSSWVPDWRDRIRVSLPILAFEKTSAFCAGGKEHPWIRMHGNLPMSRLHLKSSLVGTICTLLGRDDEALQQHYRQKYPDAGSEQPRLRETISSLKKTVNLLHYMNEWANSERRPQDELNPTPLLEYYFLRQCLQLIPDTTYPLSKKMKDDIIWQILSCEVSEGLRGLPKTRQRLQFLKSVINNDRKHRSYWFKEDDDFCSELVEWTKERQFCVTDNSAVGWAPLNAETGDVVCVLQGCDLPFVLRRVVGEEHVFTVVGHCYVAGIMHGELMQDGEVPLRDIYLQ